MISGLKRFLFGVLTGGLCICTCAGVQLAAVDVSAETSADTPAKVSAKEADGDFSYADVAGMEFYFSSGAGGWATYMTIDEDGSFSGNYHDSDMGDNGEQYPNGTLYYCDFEGEFGELTRVDAYTYRTTLKRIDFANTPETEEYKDGIRYVYATAYGLDDAEDLYFYLPGKPVSELPEEFAGWVRMAEDTAEDGKITIYGLYNENAACGFGGYPAHEDAQGSDGTEKSDADVSGEDLADENLSVADLSAEQIRAHVEKVQKKADALENRLLHEDMNQMEMNQVSGELFRLWDDEINEIWQYLTANLPAAAMQELTDEELAWIRMKEARIAEEGKQYEGGSIRPLVENRLGADLTRERVYELLEYV